jgi:pyruvate-ferredoxin/flavodoxin oxidoreductase
MKMDSKPPSVPYREYVESETRFNMLWHTLPEVAERLLEEEQRFVKHRYSFYQQLSQLDWSDGVAVAQVKAAAKVASEPAGPAKNPEGEA